MTRSMHRLLAAAAAGGIAVAALVSAGCGSAPHPSDPGDPGVSAWFATWYAAPQPYDEPPPRPTKPAKSFADRSYRQTMRIAAGGSVVRLEISNLYGTRPLAIAGMSIAPASAEPAGATAAAPVLFSGRAGVTLAPGQALASDDVAVRLAPLSEAIVTTTLASTAPVETVHTLGLRSNTLHAARGTIAPSASLETDSFYAWVVGIDVRDAGKKRVVVCFGDSITDGYGSTPNANGRYPDVLATLLLSKGGGTPSYSVVNAGISGNRWNFDGVGPRGRTRFRRDVLERAGATDVVILLGINDIGVPAMTKNRAEEETAAEIVEAIGDAAAAARGKGLKVYLGTLTPFGGTGFPGYYSPEGEAKRSQVNEAIRETLRADGVIDFDAALRDPDRPARLAARYDSGDHLHPNDAGYRAMAAAAAAFFAR